MTVRSDSVAEQPRAAGGGWYTRSPEEVAAASGVDPAVGLSAARAAGLLAAHGPNTLGGEGRRVMAAVADAQAERIRVGTFVARRSKAV
ncbi:cation-transporting P-type ATPase [Streptomyces sp. NPDC001591]|uniref:cation-transporting P-type ATPase n=1 Tax=Streptomyces sp. NPDC001591 TaxID=3364589 RepID=UPI00369CD36E